MWNVGLDDSQSGIKIAMGNINNLSYADYTTLMVESEELKNLQEGGDRCIYIADSLHCAAETNTTV